MNTSAMEGEIMKMLIDLFSTDYGLMSLGVIVFMLLMAAFFLRLFLNKMNSSACDSQSNGAMPSERKVR